MSEAILDKARELGLLLAKSEELNNVREAEATMMQNYESQSIIQEFENMQHTLQTLEEQGQPISEEKQKEFEDLHQRMFTNTNISNFFTAQASFENILNQVNKILSSSIGIDQCGCEDDGLNGQGCGCSSCS